jgi:thiamine-monophosphate kinase
MPGEFELIARHFTRPVQRAALGVGDDCALLRLAPGMQLAVSSDMLVEGRHFLSTVAPERLGHKALAVNLSDLAACGAEPLAFTLALALPRADDAFLAPLARGMLALADAHGIELVGGDTTAGPLNLCITVFGQVPAGQALLRSGAAAGDDIWVSGQLGDARLALEVFRGTLCLPGEAFETVRRAMELPQPRVALGLALRGLASSAIDLSDGLVGDLGHVLQRSVWAPWCRWTSCRAAPCWRRSRSMCSSSACWPGVTTTNCCSRRRRVTTRPCAPRRARRRGGDAHRPHRAWPCAALLDRTGAR